MSETMEQAVRQAFQEWLKRYFPDSAERRIIASSRPISWVEAEGYDLNSLSSCLKLHTGFAVSTMMLDENPSVREVSDWIQREVRRIEKKICSK